MAGLFPDEFPFVRPTAAEAGAQTPGAWTHPNEHQGEPSASLSLSPDQAQEPQTYDGPERRKIARHPLCVPATLRVGSDRAPLKQTTVGDISLTGVSFDHPTPIDPDERCIMRIDAGPLRWNSRLQVVHCTARKDGGYRIGARFVGNELLRDRPAA